MLGFLTSSVYVCRTRFWKERTVSGAGTRGEMAFREDGDVVALVGPPSLLGVVPVVPASPQSGQDARPGIGEDRRRVDDVSLGRASRWGSR